LAIGDWRLAIGDWRLRLSIDDCRCQSAIVNLNPQSPIRNPVNQQSAVANLQS